MKKIITISALLLTAFAPQAMAQEQTQPTQQTARPAFDNELLPWETPRDTTCHEVLLETTMGNIRVALYNDTPHHRDNFLKLVNSGYYNGCIFQRVIKNFMIYPKYYHKRGQLCAAREGDDENPTKASASTDFYITWGRNFSPRQMEYYVEKEKREGAKSYALPSEQLQQGYIKHGGVPHLDNGYTVFGEVLEGMDVVDKIQNVATNKDNNDRPLEDIVITRATQVK